MSPSQFAARVGVSKQAILANLIAIDPPPTILRRRSKTGSGKMVKRIEIDDAATYNPKAQGRPRNPDPKATMAHPVSQAPKGHERTNEHQATSRNQGPHARRERDQGGV